MGDFPRALAAFLSPDQTERRLGEQFVEHAYVHAPDQLVLGLIARIPDPPPLCTVAAVLLRKVIYREEGHLLSRISEECMKSMRVELLNLLAMELQPSLRRKICDVVATMGAFMLEDESWPELLPFLFRCVTAPASQAVAKENALDVIHRLSEVLVYTMKGEEARFVQVLQACLSADEALTVRLTAVKAFASLVVSMDKQDRWREYEPLIAPALALLRTVLSSGEEKMAKSLLEDLIEMACAHPRIFEGQLPEPLIPMCMQITQAKHLPNDCRHLSLELLVSLCETQPKMMRKHQPLTLLMPVLVDLVVTAPERDAAALERWGNHYPRNDGTDDADDLEEEEELDEWGFSNLEAGLEYVDRLTAAMGHKKNLSLVFDVASQLVKDAEWRHRQGGLLMVAHVVEFMDKKDPDVSQCLKLADSFARFDPHPCVRAAAVTLLARLAYDCSPFVQDFHAGPFLACALACMDDAVPRIQAHAARAIEDLCVATPSDGFIVPFLDSVVKKLFERLRSSPTIVQEQILAALAAVAENAEESFAPYFAETMPTLIPALKAAPPGVMHARLCNCISLIGVAVGKQVFYETALELCASLVATDIGANDALRHDYLSTWMRLATVLGTAELSAHLNKIVSDVFVSTASLKDFGYEGGSDGETDYRDSYRARTAAVDDKVMALQVLDSFARNLKAGFAQYAQPCFEVMLRDIHQNTAEHDDVRGLCVRGLPSMIGVWTESGAVQMAKVRGSDALAAILSALNDEESTIMISDEVLALGEVAEVMPRLNGEDAFAAHELELLCQSLAQVLADSQQRRAVAWASLGVEDEDEDADERIAAEQQVMTDLSTTLGKLVQTHPAHFLAVFMRTLGDKVMAMLPRGRTALDRRFAVFLLDDMVEFLPAQLLLPWMPQIVPALIDACVTHNVVGPMEQMFDVANLNQAAAYGLGMCALRLPMENYSQTMFAALTELVRSCPREEYTSDSGFGHAVDNAVSSMAKLARAIKASAPEASRTIYAEWQAYLPLRHDVQESCLSMHELLALMQSDQAWVDLPRSVVSLCAALGTDMISKPDAKDALAVLERLRGSLGDQVFASVPAEDMQRVREYVATAATTTTAKV